MIAMYIQNSKLNIFATTVILLSLVGTLLGMSWTENASAAPNQQINYQGKLTTAANVAVPDGTYNMRFWLLTSPTIATTSAVWTESLTSGNKVQVTSGLFSVMLGSTSPLTSVDFNQTLYLGVEIGGSTTPAWDGEMSPRKILGTVPAAFEADRLDGLDSTQFVRTDATSSIATSSSNTILTITQNGTGDIFNLFDGASEMFTVLDGGFVGVGTSSPVARFTVAGNSYFGGGVNATGTGVFGGLTSLSSSTLGFASSTALTVANNAYLNTFTANAGTTTNATSTTLFATTFNATNGTIASLLGTNATITSATTTSLNTTNLKIGADVITDITGTGLSITNGVLNAAGSSPDWVKNGALDGLTPTTTGIGIVITGASSTITGLNMVNSTTTNATTTNLFASLLRASSSTITFASSTNASSTGLTAQNAYLANLTFGTTGGVLAANSTGVVSASTTIGDSYIADALTISGGTIGSNSISGTLTTTGSLTIGDGGDAITIDSSGWDIANNILTGLTGLTVTSSSTLGFASTTALTVANNAYLNTFTANAGTTTNATTTNLAITSIIGSTQCLQVTSTGVVVGTGSACGSGSLGGTGLDGYLARWTGASTLSTGLFRDNGTVAGVNATTSTTTFNIQATAGLNPFTVASSTGARLFGVDTFGRLLTSTNPDSSLYINGGSGSLVSERSIAIGQQAMSFASSTGFFNGNDSIAIGYQALYGSSTIPSDTRRNVAIGTQALFSNVAGNSNVAIGPYSLYSNEYGSNQVAIGESALGLHRTGDDNFAFGQSSQFYNTSGYNNFSVGYRALYGSSTGMTGLANTALGYETLFNNETGNSNTAIGYTALRANTIGRNNVALGDESLLSNTTGNDNFVSGDRSAYSNIDGDNNIAIGYESLFSGTSGDNNIALGWSTLRYNTTASNNIAIGFQSGIGDGSTLNQRSLTDTFATLLGFQASRDESIASTTPLTNITAIGKNARVGQSNTIVLGGTGTDAVKVGIGSTTPSRTLTVAGDGYFLNNVSAASGTITYASTTGLTATNFNVTNFITNFASSSYASTTGLTAQNAYLNALTFGSTGGVLAANSTGVVSASTTIGDSYIADALTISGGTLGSNNISGTLTTTGSLTIGDGGDVITIDSSGWDIANNILTGLTGLNVTSSSTLGYASTTALTVANNAYLNTFTANAGTTTNATSTTLFATTFNATNGTIASLLGTNATITNATSTNMNVSGSFKLGADVITDITGTGLSITNGVLNAAGSSPDWVKNAALDGLSPTTTGIGIVITGASSTITGLNMVNSTTTNATTTNLFASLLRASSSTITYASSTALTVSGTSYLTFASSTNASSTGLTAQNAYLNALTFGSTGGVLAANSTGVVSASTTIGDSYIADALTVSGGTIGSNNISGTLTTTGSLTIGDGGDAITIDSSGWDIANNILTGLTGLTVTSSSTLGYASTTALTVAGNSFLGGNVVVGTTTPYAKFSIQNAYGSTTALFDIATTTSAGFATSSLFRVGHDGKVSIGSSTPESLGLTINKTNIAGASIAGIKEYFQFLNTASGSVSYGDNAYILNSSTATSTLVGKVIRIEDSTAFGNTVRGLEVQAQRGTNTKGENTGLSGFGRTFGIKGTTEGDAGDTFVPAGVFAESKGTTQGNALRAYSGNITTSSLVQLFQDTSVFSGTGLLMNFGNSGGSFAATSSAKFLDFKVSGTSKFTVTAGGTTTIGDGTTANMAGLQIGYGGLCVDNDGACTATTTGRITAVQYGTANSDLAEMYFSSEDLLTGDIVALRGGLSIGRATEGDDTYIVGVISTKPGVTMGYDDSSLVSNEVGHPVALKGRVPVRLSTENGPIKKGDRIALSSIPGVGMKATESGTTVGIALEDFDGDTAYSEGYLNQFGDDLVKAKLKPLSKDIDPRTQDGCSFGGGSAQGEAGCVKDKVTEVKVETVTIDNRTEILKELSREDALSMTTREGKAVEVGQVIMFVQLDNHMIASETNILKELLATSTLENGSGEETLWSRIKTLAQNFVDGVLSVAGIKTDELCVGEVCVNESEFLKIIENSRATPVDNTPEPLPEENDPPPADDAEDEEGTENEGGGDTTETPPEDTGTTTEESVPDEEEEVIVEEEVSGDSGEAEVPPEEEIVTTSEPEGETEEESVPPTTPEAPTTP